jgi:hypothetical protein
MTDARRWFLVSRDVGLFAGSTLIYWLCADIPKDRDELVARGAGPEFLDGAQVGDCFGSTEALFVRLGRCWGQV